MIDENTNIDVVFHSFANGDLVVPEGKFLYVTRTTTNIVSNLNGVRKVREFYMSKDFMELTPIKGSQLAMYKLRANAKKMYVLTGRQEVVREETETWIQHYFPGIFDGGR